MSDTPIAERLAAELGMPWPMRMHGTLFDYFSEPRALGSEMGALADPHRDAASSGPVGAASTRHQEATVADPNCDKCGGTGIITTMTESGWIRRGNCDC